MSLLLSKHFLFSLALGFPLLQNLIQICMPPSMLNHTQRFCGLISLAITLCILGLFGREIPSELDIFSFHFSVTTLSLVFWSAKNLMVFLIERFSLRYLFQEPGIKKFYFMISLFSFSLNLVFFSDSFTPFTLGWELMGLASVILIAFFDHRRATVERSFLTFLFYKLGDFFLLAALLYVAQTTHIESFQDLKQWADVYEGGSLILCLFVLSAFVKSGLLPFSFWLPRSMEGPTPSSALFYGALSSHAGAFLLLRLSLEMGGFSGAPFFLMILISTLTALFAYLMALTRTDIKSQIIYSVLCQLSVIFIEIALGWRTMALIHSLLHMFFRLFQFLVAPSAIYLAHEKDFLSPKDLASTKQRSEFQKKWHHGVWWLSLHEFGLPIFWRRCALDPILWIGQAFRRIKRSLHYATASISKPYLRSLSPRHRDITHYIFFLMIVALPIITQSHKTISVAGVFICQIIALGFSLMTIEEKRLSTSFFNLIFSGTFLVISYYYSTTPEHVHLFYVHLTLTAVGFSLLGALFIFFRNAFDLPDGSTFFGLHKISPFLSMIFAVFILFILGFPGFTTYFSFELLSADLSQMSAFASISGLAILNINAYLWFNIYAKLFWGERASS
ncbi:MAG: hypothetical protein HYY62_03275 [Deltaproteobacteria bacterium]|nr:hypothetical protein [Deltaproteobacteria bacterium]